MKWLNHASPSNQSHAAPATQKSCSSDEIQACFGILYFLEGFWMKKRTWLRPVLLSCMPRASEGDIHIPLVLLQTENSFAVWFDALKEIIHAVTALQNISVLILCMLLYDCSAGKKCFTESVVMGSSKVSKSLLSILISGLTPHPCCISSLRFLPCNVASSGIPDTVAQHRLNVVHDKVRWCFIGCYL